MAATVIKRCPHCKNIFETGIDSRGIGIPFKICQSCDGYIIDTDETEWELKSPFSKLLYFLICAWTSIQYGILPLIAALFIGPKFGVNFENKELFTFWGIGTLVLAFLIIKANSIDIRESKTRMQNPEYRKTLEKLGLIRPQQLLNN